MKVSAFARKVRGDALCVARFVKAVVKRFYDDNCLRHASGLAYTTLLSLVPLLALMFSVLKGLGVQRRLEPLLLSRLMLEEETARQVIEFIDRTNVRTLGALGASALLLTVISVLGTVEASFNEIWRVRVGRTALRRIADYASAVLLVPLLLLVAVAITSSSYSRALVEFLLSIRLLGDFVLFAMQFFPVLINAGALAMMYALIPNRRAHAPSIFAGALVAGALLQITQMAYITLQIGVARYNAIYGALSQLPVTLVWLYVCWAIILIGAEVAATYEIGAEVVRGRPQPASRWAVAAHVLLRAAENFRGMGTPLVVPGLAREMRVESEAVHEVVEQLCDAGYLVHAEGSPTRYVLAQDPSIIDLASLEALVETDMVPPGCDARIKALLDRLAADRLRSWQNHALADLLREPTPEPSVAALRRTAT